MLLKKGRSVHVEVDIYVDDVVFTPPISSVRAQNSFYIYIYVYVYIYVCVYIPVI